MPTNIHDEARHTGGSSLISQGLILKRGLKYDRNKEEYQSNYNL